MTASSRWVSWFEVTLNAVISLIACWAVPYLMGLSAGEGIFVSVVLTIISAIRMYSIRRLFVIIYKD